MNFGNRALRTCARVASAEILEFEISDVQHEIHTLLGADRAEVAETRQIARAGIHQFLKSDIEVFNNPQRDARFQDADEIVARFLSI